MIRIPFTIPGVLKNSRPVPEPVVVRGNDHPAVVIRELMVCRDRLPVLCDISLAVPQGETLAVLGPNGAGKSTLLKCLAGSVRPTHGSVQWFGQPGAQSPVVRRQIGFVGHECGLYRELTAAENLVFAGRMFGVERPAETATKLLRDACLEWAANRAVGKLSQGMCRRLAIARMLVHEPRLILLDEPFASLDSDGCGWLERLFAQWRNEGRTVCFACHDADKSRVAADRLVWLECGHVAAWERCREPLEIRERCA
jgi:heme ABC exporter ATP-binding subunit CcmA